MCFQFFAHALYLINSAVANKKSKLHKYLETAKKYLFSLIESQSSFNEENECIVQLINIV